ncbi:hypothetical protein [Kutzneria albida]|uniref:Nudix hydrolase domain-containing protein n=1 Tax=Kutzneria albida DSM 43870 TaxID=1449976 RepID=W5WK58_9PSEU|nr:hypothetical protein [Kutzneria albida]AHH98564.1 hypothetical protein KALB_5202 [Kutzneria albida DSM 43870]
MTAAGGSRVSVVALTCRPTDGHYLTLPTEHALVFPGGPVNLGESVERALRRILHDQLATWARTMDFCAVLEHATAEASVELVFVFDVTLTRASDRIVRWVGHEWLRLLEVHPVCLRDALATEALIRRAWITTIPDAD